MGKSEIITGLDIGSGRVTCVIAERDEVAGKIRILSGSFVESKSFKSGMVLNIEEAARAIGIAVEAAESKANQVVSEVLLGVRGPYLQSFDSKGRYNIARTDQEITSEDVTNVIENAKTFPMSHGLELVHVIPQKFSLDRLAGVPNPVGMQAAMIEVGVHIVLAASPAISNLIKSVATAGFRLADNPIYTLLALGELAVSDEEKELGTLLIDFGGQTTSVAIYVDGAIHFSKELPVGGDHITHDIAHGLGCTMAAAREIKEKHGAVYSDLIDPDRFINVANVDRRTKKEIKQRELLRFIQPRVEEIYEFIFQAVEKSNNTDLPGGVILTGGGALLNGMPAAASELLGLPQARLAVPMQELLDCPEEYLAQPYLGAVALTCYPHLKTWNTDLHGYPHRGSLAKKVLSWVSDLF